MNHFLYLLSYHENIILNRWWVLQKSKIYLSSGDVDGSCILMKPIFCARLTSHRLSIYSQIWQDGAFTLTIVVWIFNWAIKSISLAEMIARNDPIPKNCYQRKSVHTKKCQQQFQNFSQMFLNGVPFIHKIVI